MNTDDKIEINIKAEIHFYNIKREMPDFFSSLAGITRNRLEIGIVSENLLSSGNEKFSPELLFFILYFLRNGVNLRYHLRSNVNAAGSIGDFINEVAEILVNNRIKERLFFNYNEISNLFSYKPSEIYYFRLIEHPNYDGQKIFLSNCIYNNNKIDFKLKGRGFGFLNLGGEVLDYSPLSIMGLMAYLIEWYIKNSKTEGIKSLLSIAFITHLCLLTGQIGITNEYNVASNLFHLTLLRKSGFSPALLFDDIFVARDSYKISELIREILGIK